MKNTDLAALLPLVLSACAAGPQPSDADMERSRAPLYCDGADQCTAMWKRAQVWIANNGHYRVQLVSDAIINTYGPVYPEVWYAYQVVREPVGDGREEIKLSGACANRFICHGNLDIYRADFKRFVSRQ
jgi:hypothetical protein